MFVIVFTMENHHSIFTYTTHARRALEAMILSSILVLKAINKHDSIPCVNEVFLTSVFLLHARNQL